MGSIHLFRDLPEVKAFASGEYIFRKGEQGSLVADLVEAGEEPPATEDYPVDDDIPESEY